ncbi:hypothetical protein RCC89_08510 [Cytophagaceae bacterium ABcell3]|nr:hypothetical protein RCC89_08510 [Cytophagaceae bacterium ABcell3]
MKNLTYYILAACVLLLWSCDEAVQEHPIKETDIVAQSPDSVENTSDADEAPSKELFFNAISNEDKNKLALTEQVPLGSSYTDVQTLFSETEISELDKSKALSTATLPINIIDRKGSIVFNFSSDSLNKLTYTLTETDFEKGEELYIDLQNFYSLRYGPAIEDKVEEHNRFTRACHWDSELYIVTMTWNMNSNQISWTIAQKQEETKVN